MAEACGGVGVKVAEPAEIGRAIRQGIDSNRPAVIDIAIDPDVLILPPRIEFSQAMNFGLANLREFLGAD